MDREREGPEFKQLLPPWALVSAVALSVVIVCADVPATHAQSPPSRIANIWNSMSHQPTRSGVRAAEQSAGVALSREQKGQTDKELNRLYQQLLGAQHKVTTNKGEP